MKLAITVCATTHYAYALSAQLRRVQAALRYANWTHGGRFILVTNSATTANKWWQLGKQLLPEFEFDTIVEKLPDGTKNYKEDAQLLIAQMRTAAFSKARAHDSDLCWSLDSDVLPSPNAFECMLWSLKFDRGYYSVATCPYVSQGGGGFLGGRGTSTQHILPDFLPGERTVPAELQKKYDDAVQERDKLVAELEALRSDASDLGRQNWAKAESKVKDTHVVLQELEKQLQACPPKANVFGANAVRWRRRGWLDHAYPAIGKGAMLPSDWCGFGCTLMNREALTEADFTGYEGRGTEDLHVVWSCWHKAGMRLNVLTHCPADHVIRNPGKPGQYVLIKVTHETEGECVGHLRQRAQPWYSFDLGEVFNPENDGVLRPA